MKKIFSLLSFALLFIQATRGPKHDVCGPYDPNRTLEQFKRAVLDTTNTFMVTQVWPAYVNEANRIVQTSSDPNVTRMHFEPRLKDMKFILYYSIDAHVSLHNWKDYVNSHREGNVLVFQEEQGNLSDWIVFQYKDVSGVYAKKACFNPQKKKLQEKQEEPSESDFYEKPLKISNPDTVYVPIHDTTVINKQAPSPNLAVQPEQKKFQPQTSQNYGEEMRDYRTNPAGPRYTRSQNNYSNNSYSNYNNYNYSVGFNYQQQQVFLDRNVGVPRSTVPVIEVGKGSGTNGKGGTNGDGSGTNGQGGTNNSGSGTNGKGG